MTGRRDPARRLAGASASAATPYPCAGAGLRAGARFASRRRRPRAGGGGLAHPIGARTFGPVREHRRPGRGGERSGEGPSR